MTDGFEYYCIEAFQSKQPDETLCACAMFLTKQGLGELSQTLTRHYPLQCAASIEATKPTT